jgi:hypothetical protein
MKPEANHPQETGTRPGRLQRFDPASWLNWAERYRGSMSESAYFRDGHGCAGPRARHQGDLHRPTVIQRRNRIAGV